MSASKDASAKRITVDVRHEARCRYSSATQCSANSGNVVGDDVHHVTRRDVESLLAMRYPNAHVRLTPSVRHDERQNLPSFDTLVGMRGSARLAPYRASSLAIATGSENA